VARPGGAQFVVLSHASDEDGTREFAGRISTTVRELGLHHPRSSVSRFVTVSFEVTVVDTTDEHGNTGKFMVDSLDWVSE